MGQGQPGFELFFACTPHTLPTAHRTPRLHTTTAFSRTCAPHCWRARTPHHHLHHALRRRLRRTRFRDRTVGFHAHADFFTLTRRTPTFWRPGRGLPIRIRIITCCKHRTRLAPTAAARATLCTHWRAKHVVHTTSGMFPRFLQDGTLCDALGTPPPPTPFPTPHTRLQLLPLQLPLGAARWLLGAGGYCTHMAEETPTLSLHPRFYQVRALHACGSIHTCLCSRTWPGHHAVAYRFGPPRLHLT